MLITSLCGVRGRTFVIAAVAAGVLALVGCDDGTEAPSAAAQVVEAVVLDVAKGVPADADDPDALPVVYVVSASDEPFSAQVQAAVASAVKDVVDVRFADARAESVDDDQPGRPVRDGGAMVAIGPLVADTAPMVIEVEVYRTEGQFSRRALTFGRTGDDWSQSESSLLEEVDVAPTTVPSDDDREEDGAPADPSPGSAGESSPASSITSVSSPTVASPSTTPATSGP